MPQHPVFLETNHQSCKILITSKALEKVFLITSISTRYYHDTSTISAELQDRRYSELENEVFIPTCS